MQLYVSKDGQRYGPYTAEQLQKYLEQGYFTLQDHAICEGWEQWVTIDQLVELDEEPESPVPIEPTAEVEPKETAIQPSGESGGDAEPTGDTKPEDATGRKPKSGKKRVMVIGAAGIGLVIAIVVAFFSFPGEEEEKPDEVVAKAEDSQPAAPADSEEKNESAQKTREADEARLMAEQKAAKALQKAKEQAEAEKQAKREEEEQARRSGAALKLIPESTEGYKRIEVRLLEKSLMDTTDTGKNKDFQFADNLRFWPPFWSGPQKGEGDKDKDPAVAFFPTLNDAGKAIGPKGTQGRLEFSIQKLKAVRKTVEIECNASWEGATLLLRPSPTAHEFLRLTLDPKTEVSLKWEGAEKLSGRRDAYIKSVNLDALRTLIEEYSSEQSIRDYPDHDPFPPLLSPEIQALPTRIGEVPFFRKGNFSGLLRKLDEKKKDEDDRQAKVGAKAKLELLLKNLAKHLQLEKELSSGKMIAPTPEGKAGEFLKKACREITLIHHLRLDEKHFVRKSPTECMGVIRELSENFAGKMVQGQFKRDLETTINRIIRAEAKLAKVIKQEIEYEGEVDITQKALEEFKRNKLKGAVFEAKEDLADKQQQAVEFYELHELGEVGESTKVNVVVKEVETKLVEKTKVALKHIHDELSSHVHDLPLAFDKSLRLSSSRTMEQRNLISSLQDHRDATKAAALELLEEYPPEFSYEGHVVLRLRQMTAK